MTDLTAARNAYNAALINFKSDADYFDKRAAYEAAREDLYIAEAIAERAAFEAAEIEADRKFWKNRAF
jgi:hypothetical protein